MSLSTRRAFLQLLAMTLAWRFSAPVGETADDGVVEVNGWILRRSDLS